MVDCDRWINGTCGVIAELTMCDRSLCVVSDQACAVCVACEKPKTLNHVTASIGLTVAKQSLKGDDFAKVRDKLAPAITVETIPPVRAGGPGSELKKLLGWLGIKPTANCQCNARARDMDLRGPDWCESNQGEILAWLREEAGRRGLPFVEIAAKSLVRLAIRRARAEA